MKRSMPVAWKDFSLSLYSPMAYIFMIVFTGLLLFLFFKAFFLIGEASLRNMFELLPWFLIIFVPAITMKSFADEIRTGTIEILQTYPVSTTRIVIEKFLSALFLLLLTLVFTLPAAITLYFIGKPDTGEIISGYIGASLLGGAFISIGIFASSISKHQVISFIIAVILSFILYFLSYPVFTLGLSSQITSFFQYLALSGHYDNFIKGILDTRDVVYYLSFIFLFLYFTYYVLERRR